MKLIDELNKVKGIQSKKFGPMLWDSLFLSVLGAFPIRINTKNKEHMRIRKAFITQMNNMKYTLPCSFCRKSYTAFYKELDINKYSYSRYDMFRWLYLLKDKVNTKLIKQELDYLNNLHSEYKNGKISKEEFTKIKKSCFFTQPTPSLGTVIQKYLAFSATCSKKMKKCVSK